MQKTLYKFSSAFVDSGGSAIRELAKIADDPAIISFAAGYPAIDSFDYEGLELAANQAWRDKPRECMQYLSSEGNESLAKELLTVSQGRGIEARRDELLITTGSQQAFDFLLRCLIEPGDTVFVEMPTYPGALAALRIAGANIVGIEGDAQGINPDAVRAALDAAPTKPKLLYLVADFANPTGATLSKERRVALAQLAVEHQFLLVEDDPYGLLRFSGEKISPIRSLIDEVPGSRDWLIYMSTLSKSLSPGLRLGWLIAPAEITRRCVKAKQVSDLCSSPWNQVVATTYLQSGRFETHLPKVVSIYQNRGEGLAEELKRAFGSDLSFATPDGGMFLWASFKDKIDPKVLLKNAIEQKVVFVPGGACYHDARESASIRLSYSTATPDTVGEGVRRLRKAYELSI